MSEKKKNVNRKTLNESELSATVVLLESQDERCKHDKSIKDISSSMSVMNYEEELLKKWNEIQRDQLKILLIFPDDDVLLHKKSAEFRTEYSTVPQQAFKDATSLLVRECLNVFTCDHYILQKKYKNYGATYNQLDNNPIRKIQDSLCNHLFESDVDIDEADAIQDTMLVPTKENGIYKEGYLTKAPFHNDTNTPVGAKAVESAIAKNYKRRWFTLKQTSSDSSYTLEYRKEEGSAFAKGTLYLDSCTQIRKGIKGRMYGFELHIQDKIYGLAADSLNEMDTWIKALCRATGIEIEADKPSNSLLGSRLTKTKQHKNMRESLRNSSHPLLQEYGKESDQLNWKNRQENRLKIFSIYPDLHNNYDINDDFDDLVEPFREARRAKFVMTCQDLKFKLNLPNKSASKTGNCEPFFLSFSLYDVRLGKKISEDFHCDLNDDDVKDVYPSEIEVVENGTLHVSPGGVEDQKYLCPKICIFSVDCPHTDIFLVLHINKMLQGSISQCAEPYLKPAENLKTAQKVSKQVRMMSKRVGKFKMPFAWAARPIFKSDAGEIDTATDFSPIYKQENNKLTDEEMIKLLGSEAKTSKQVLPGSFKCTITPLQPNHPNCYTPSLIPIKPFSHSTDIKPSVEIQSFGPMKTEEITPSTTYMNNFYVYPISLNYNNQKGMKARNISCTIEFKDCDEISAKPLKCIYTHNGSCTFTHQIICPVIYHCTSPTFFSEIKILLPPQLSAKHHILFTFHHVSVEQPKETKEKKKDIVTPVGYAWMPILEDNIVRQDESFLPVASFLPEGYMTMQNVGGGKVLGPDIKWADGKGQNLFKVNTKLVSTTYTQDANINNFYDHWQVSEGKASDVETCRLLKLLHGIDVNVVIKFLPALLNTMFKVLIQVNNEDIAVNVVSLLIRITSIMHEEKKKRLLKSYVKYVFQMEGKSGKTVHEELAHHLHFYLELGADPIMIENILQHSWFFFNVMVKSMASFIFLKERSAKFSRESRQKRFSEQYLKSLESMIQVYISQLVSRAKDKKEVAKEANLNMALFIKACLTHMDRGYMFQIINYVKDQYKATDPLMYELKFEFLRCLCEHEHFIPLNLPFDIRLKGEVHESVISDRFCYHHFLVGVLLKEVSAALYHQKDIRTYALRVLRNLLVKHEFDDRYTNEEMQSRIAALYIPYLTTMLEHSLRFHKNFEPPKLEDSLLAVHSVVESPLTPPLSSPSFNYSPSLSSPPSLSSLNQAKKYLSVSPFDSDESKELVICFLYILKNLRSVIIVDWWRDILTTPIKRPLSASNVYNMQGQKHFAKFMAVIDFFDLLENCIKMFEYPGIKAHDERNKKISPESTKQILENKYSSLGRGTNSLLVPAVAHKRQHSAGSQVNFTYLEMFGSHRPKLESNLSTEVAIIVLDMLELFCIHFKFHLEQDDGDNVLMKKIFTVMMTFLRIGQSEYVLKLVFASLRSFIHKFHAVLFRGSAALCGILCFEILRLCNAKMKSIRDQACCFLYLLMRSNFEFSGTSCVRVHHQVIVAISKLIADGMNRSWMNHALVQLKDYAAEDKGMKKTEFPSEVRDLIKKVHTVLLATVQMKEYQDDHEVLVDLQYSLAKSYASTPELRQTWLQSMAVIHAKNGDHSEAAMCYIHSAALVAEYLKMKGCSAIGCSGFKTISPNIIPDENVPKDDEGESGEMRYQKEHLLNLLKASIDQFKAAERYELIGEVYKLAIPLYEEARDYKELASAYGTLKEAYDKIVEVMISGKRVLGRYYRVAFYGRAFKDNDGKEFVYKEPKLTSLPEISQRLKEKYESKHGNVKLIHDSSKVKPEELNPAVNYIQVTFVQPFFDEEEYARRVTEFERENDIRRFVFETPFTLTGKSHGALVEQHKRKTILTTSHSFPYVKKRIIVVQQEQYELSPIEVAIDEMQNRVKDLNLVISLSPPDMKKLQLKLAGSVSVQVNAGPLAYAETFLEEFVVKNYMSKHVEALQLTYRELVKACGQALELNGVLIKPDQKAYHDDLKERYFDLKQKVSSYLSEDIGDDILITSPSQSEA